MYSYLLVCLFYSSISKLANYWAALQHLDFYAPATYITHFTKRCSFSLLTYTQRRKAKGVVYCKPPTAEGGLLTVNDPPTLPEAPLLAENQGKSGINPPPPHQYTQLTSIMKIGGGVEGVNQRDPNRPQLLKHLHKVTNSQLLYIGVG